MPEPAEVWITGIGLASSLGEGLDANWDALQAGRINADEKTFAPYVVHPLAQINFDAQIPKKGDQRQMEAWQRIGTYAAGLALESAGVKNDKEILGRMDMVISAGGGERDIQVDNTILDLKVSLKTLLMEAVASFGETALHAAASEQHRDAALDAGAKALTILECGAALVRFAPRCSLAAPLRNAHQLDASVLARCKVLLTEEAAIRAI